MLRKVIIACTGSVAVFSIPNLIIALRRAFDAQIIPMMSPSAAKFITPFGLSIVAGSDVIASGIDVNSLKQRLNGANVFLIAPATANTIAGLASGRSASLIDRTFAIFEGPVVVAPAMNGNMWHHPATQRNIHTLREMDVNLVMPGDGIEITDLRRSVSALASIDQIIAKLIEVS